MKMLISRVVYKDFDLQNLRSQGRLDKNDRMSPNNRKIYILKSLATSLDEDLLAVKTSLMVFVRFSENAQKALKI